MLDISLLEVSYEVANKVGGINTVLVSKIRNIQSNVREYITIGPYYKEKAEIEFKPSEPPQSIRKVFDSVLNNYGIVCYYGRWLVEDKPLCILVDSGSMHRKANEIKKELWEKFKIDSMHADSWYDEPVVWSRAVGIVIEEMMKNNVLKYKPIAHFHEWLTGAALLYLKTKDVRIGTVFTTHSTVLGRAIAEIGKENLYDLIDAGIRENKTVPKEKIYKYKVQAKHSMESACAHNADVFSAVSETIEKECIFMLGKKPDIILPNGLNMDRFPKIKDMEEKHKIYNDQIKLFIEEYFSPYYKVDTNNMLLFFISGRFEFHNKGIDVFIDALGSLNNRLKIKGTNKQVIVFILVPSYAKRRNRDSGTNKPPISPFIFHSKNAITIALEKNGLLNNKNDSVKVIFYPVYLSENDGLIGLNYYDAIKGFDLGVFPSYYESWGYTPVETAASGIQSVTTDLSGFGKFIKKYLKKNEYSIIVLNRDERKYEDVVKELENVMYKITFMSRKKIHENRIRAKRLSLFSGWERLIKYYLKAYDMTIKKKQL